MLLSPGDVAPGELLLGLSVLALGFAGNGERPHGNAQGSLAFDRRFFHGHAHMHAAFGICVGRRHHYRLPHFPAPRHKHVERVGARIHAPEAKSAVGVAKRGGGERRGCPVKRNGAHGGRCEAPFERKRLLGEARLAAASQPATILRQRIPHLTARGVRRRQSEPL